MHRHPFVSALLAAALAAAPAAARAQSVAQHLAAGDSARAARRAPEALRHYLAAIAEDSTSASALWRASRTEAELAEFAPDSARRDSLLQAAERHGRAAVAADPKNAHAHFALAEALGRIALTLPTTNRLPYAEEVHEEVTACLAIAPKDAWCLHVLALWNAEYMRLGTFTREMANSLTGGKLFAGASWEEAERDLRAAIEIEPERAIHHLDLARIYLDEGKKDAARAELEAVEKAPVRDYNDPAYQAEAKKALAAM